MRLTPAQRRVIVDCVRQKLDPQARIWLFGSRVDDERRGGDVDLYVETPSRPPVLNELRCKVALKEALDLKVDLIVAEVDAHTPIATIAKGSGIRL